MRLLIAYSSYMWRLWPCICSPVDMGQGSQGRQVRQEWNDRWLLLLRYRKRRLHTAWSNWPGESSSLSSGFLSLLSISLFLSISLLIPSLYFPPLCVWERERVYVCICVFMCLRLCWCVWVRDRVYMCICVYGCVGVCMCAILIPLFYYSKQTYFQQECLLQHILKLILFVLQEKAQLTMRFVEQSWKENWCHQVSLSQPSLLNFIILLFLSGFLDSRLSCSN